MKTAAHLLTLGIALAPLSANAADCAFDLSKLERKIEKNIAILCHDYKPLVIPDCAKTQIDSLERGKTRMIYYDVKGLKTYIEGYGPEGLQTINMRRGDDFWAIFSIDGELGKVNKVRVRGTKEFDLRSSCGKKKKS